MRVVEEEEEEHHSPVHIWKHTHSLPSAFTDDEPSDGVRGASPGETQQGSGVKRLRFGQRRDQEPSTNYQNRNASSMRHKHGECST